MSPSSKPARKWPIWARRWLRRLGWTGAGFVVLVLLLLGTFELVVRARAYPVGDLAPRADSQRLRDARGGLLREAVNGQGTRAAWVALTEMSPLVIDATIAVEDARFFSHDGIDRIGVLRASFDALRHGRAVSGASTLTMQLVRLVHPHARSLAGKLGEMVDARRLERAVSKRTILEQYLNRAPYGAGAVGIEAASQRFFGKPSRHLSQAEAALLAGLPKAPTDLNPLLHPAAARARQRVVLARLVRTGKLTRAARDSALAEPLRYATSPPTAAPHFTDYVLSLHPPPGEIATTLDPALQADAERLLAEHVRTLAPSGVTNAAAVILDNASCGILAMVGSADYHEPSSGAVNGAVARRQPGSALKPFTYALAFEAGATPASVVADIETRYGDPEGTLFAPQNYSKDFLGPVLMGDALGMSLNVPALRVANRVGPDALLERLHRLGFASLDQPAAHYGLGLTLGNGEVTLLELAQGYAALARTGVACRATPFAAVAAATAAGARPATTPRVLPAEIAYLISDVLSDEGLRSAAFGPANALLLGFPVAVKTGTSSNFRDNWAIGYTQRYTVAIWSGDFGGNSMNHLAGASGAGPLFHRLMTRAVARDPAHLGPRPFDAPPGVVEVSVCALSGQRPGPSCPHTRTVHVTRDHAPSEPCPWHREVAIDRRNGLLASPRCPARFVDHRVFAALPASYSSWQRAHDFESPPTRESPLCPSAGVIPGALVITYPRPGEVFLIEPGYDPRTQTLGLTAEVDPPLPEVTWHLDGRPLAAARWPYDTTWQLRPGPHTLELIAAGKRSDPISFEVR